MDLSSFTLYNYYAPSETEGIASLSDAWSFRPSVSLSYAHGAKTVHFRHYRTLIGNSIHSILEVEPALVYVAL